ncbi:hypothetical protein KQX54_017314 [Cotesia glomerata]|uniref:Uncharacterized protein n=1 Tax=Cotesia glomerata TaxID=32391 RepID=A0AAV7I5A8_COTGL|nr:hypothetical protein KQX54_017314 [Cotesia glomerata]
MKEEALSMARGTSADTPLACEHTTHNRYSTYTRQRLFSYSIDFSKSFAGGSCGVDCRLCARTYLCRPWCVSKDRGVLTLSVCLTFNTRVLCIHPSLPLSFPCIYTLLSSLVRLSLHPHPPRGSTLELPALCRTNSPGPAIADYSPPTPLTQSPRPARPLILCTQQSRIEKRERKTPRRPWLAVARTPTMVIKQNVDGCGILIQ